jgi:hypothetical protein
VVAMSDVVKWALLGAGLVVLIGLVSNLPIVSYINFSQFNTALGNIINVVGVTFKRSRSLINLFLLPFGRTILSGLIIWLFGKWAIMVSVKTVAWVYHFIFRG